MPQFIVVGTSQDIKDRQQAERALRESEERYRLLVETLPVIVYHVEADPPYAPIYVSANILSLGYSIEDWFNGPQLWVSLLHPDDRERVLRETEAAMAAGVETEYEYRVVARDGSTVWLHDRGRLVAGFNGKRVWQGVMLDITARKRAEDELLKSEEGHRQLFESNPQPMFVVDRETLRFLAVNDAAIEHYGYAREEVLKMAMSDIEPRKGADPGFGNTSEAVTGVEDTGIRQHRKKGGRIIDVEVVSHSIAFANRDAELVLVNDLTELREIAGRLRDREEKYRTILDRIEDGYFEVDLRGNFTFFNEALRAIFGYPAEELMGMDYRRYTAPEAALRVYQIFNDVYHTGESASPYAYRVIHHDGSSRFVESSATLMRDAMGQPAGFLGIMRDITTRKQAEEALTRSEERYRSIVEDMTEAYWEMDLAGNFTFCNNQLTVEQKRTREELIGLNNKQYMDEATLKRVGKVFKQIYLSRESARQVAYEMTKATAPGTSLNRMSPLSEMKKADRSAIAGSIAT